jgi:hypothetical protein
MKVRKRLVSCILLFLFVLLIVGGCAKTQVTNREPVPGLFPRPANVWVYDFAVSPAEIPSDSAFAGQYGRGPMNYTAEDLETGRVVGARIAMELVKHISKMGLPSIRAVPGAKPQINDVILRGYIISFDVGDAKKRIGIGLASGTSGLEVAVEGYQVTAQGLRLLGSGTGESGGGKTPGMAVGGAAWIATGNPAGFILSTGMKIYGEASGKSTIEGRADDTAKEIAEILKKRFQGQGWIY